MGKKQIKKAESGELDNLKQQVADLENKLKRVLADYDNLEKRLAKDRKDYIELANASLLDKLLAVLDDIKLCRKHTQDKGVSLVCDRFAEVLKSEGVQQMDVLGKDFDAQTMDATEVAPGEKNKVVEVVSDGYILGDKVLRPARVKVGMGEINEKFSETSS